ncbi:asparagine synthase (glutamine-hydrolyzing) [Rosistilla oblonga]|uniref:asparagine synthase (glutamine-hydrolyzing) n=1 Tax=Rosistilla oblonga TaxID=2527990 RepID=A0A518IUC6_9BACT|nr:asparagine synthase (glutamine-hydrolyzing) [Rosistilla oblonga]QDV56689.1 Asparagine synthetase [glutamine-hydrolyzing] 1 [Rosistilla oblonga]
MCGITGGLWTHPQHSISADVLQRMTEAIRHRGPDDSGTHAEAMRTDPSGPVPGVALGFRRLSIIDLAGGHQPMSNEDGSIWMVFNGEIYNFGDLRRRLEGAGHRFGSSSDGESILHLYEDLGVECFSHLNGMFAVAIWDRNRRRIVLARDRLGQKPLHYTVQDDRLLFASELKSLMEVPGLRREIDPSAIDEFLTYQYVPHPNTIYRDIHKLPPGHFAVFEDEHLSVKRYWDIDLAKETPMTQEEASEQLRELLSDSVRLRLQSDVPLGAFLSGGIDSSLIVALAQQQRDDPIRTFSIGFPLKDFDETHYAKQVADHLGTQHTRFEVQPNAVDVIDKLVWHYDEPFGDSSAIPTWYLSELTRREVTVALSGDGGDELFAGYDRYRALWISRQMDRMLPMRGMLGAKWIQRLPDSTRQRSLIRRGKRFCDAISQPPARRFMNWLQIFPEALRGEIYNEDFVKQLPGDDPFEFFHMAWKQSGNRDDVTKASLADLMTYLPCDLCTKVDIASMAHGLEVRQPMLDYRVVELAARMPVKWKFRGKRGKLILDDTFGSMIPKNIWTRKKMGFGIPIAAWFKNEWRPMLHDMLLAPDAKHQQFFRPEVVAKMVHDHETGAVNHGYRLWNLLILEKWLRRWT